MSDLNLRIAISIHALREEGDAGPAFPRCRPAISIHALREEGDAAKSMWNAQPAEFLSTPSARRATFIRRLAGACVKNFYPRPPRGGRHYVFEYAIPLYPFLSTPSARRATYDILGLQRTKEFLSTPSARRATRTTAFRTTTTPNFYPRPPRGGRLCPAWLRFCRCCYFYPRPPRGGRQGFYCTAVVLYAISIHALREEGD